MKLWAVYVQFQPEWKYEQELKSLWEDREDAVTAAIKHMNIYDTIWIEQILVNSDDLVDDLGMFVKIKP